MSRQRRPIGPGTDPTTGGNITGGGTAREFTDAQNSGSWWKVTNISAADIYVKIGEAATATHYDEIVSAGTTKWFETPTASIYLYSGTNATKNTGFEVRCWQ